MNAADIYTSEVDAQKALEEASKAKLILTDDLPMSDEEQLKILRDANAQAAQQAAELAAKTKKAEIDQ